MSNVALVIGVVGTPTAQDTYLQGRLTTMGHTVTLVDDTASVLSGQDLHVIADSCSATSIGTKYDALTVPVLTCDVDTPDQIRMFTGSNSNNSGLTWTMASHQITKGIGTGTVTMKAATNAGRWGWSDSNDGSGIQIFATNPNASTSVLGAVYPVGTGTGAGGVDIPSRRGFLSLLEGFMTTSPHANIGLTFDHAVVWMLARAQAEIGSWNGEGLSAGSFTASSEGTGDSDIGSVNGSTMSVEVAGTRAPQIKWTGGNTGYAIWGHTPQYKIAHRFYYKVSSSFGTGHRVALAWASSDPAWMLDINGSGDVYLLNGAGSTLDNSSGGLLDLDTEYRFEITYDQGESTVYIYDGDSTSPLDTLVGAVQTSKAVTQFWWGTTFDTTRGNAFGDAMKIVADYSALIGPAPAPDTEPDPPTIGLAIPAANAAAISWTPPVDDGGGAITGYRITPYLDGTTPETPIDVGVVTWTLITGLTPSDDYTFTVMAENAIGFSDESAESNMITVDSSSGTDPRGALFERTDLRYGTAIGAWEFNAGDAFEAPALARTNALGATIIRYQMWRVPSELGGTQPMSDVEDALDAIIASGAIPLVGLPPISSHQWEENVDGTDPWTTAWQELLIETAVAKGVTLFEMGNEPDNYGPPHGAGGIFFSGQEYFDQLWVGVPDLKEYARTELSTEIFIGGPSWANLYENNVPDILDWLENLRDAYLADGNRDWIPDFVSAHTYLITPDEHTESEADDRIADWIVRYGVIQDFINDEFDGLTDQGFPISTQMKLAVSEYNSTIDNESTINDTQTWTDYYYAAMQDMFTAIDAFIAIQFTILSHEGGALDLLELDGDRKPAYISFKALIDAALGMSGGTFTVWNGTEELPVASVTLWNGTEEVPITSLEISI